MRSPRPPLKPAQPFLEFPEGIAELLVRHCLPVQALILTFALARSPANTRAILATLFRFPAWARQLFSTALAGSRS